jgi:hypothetical protein
LPVEGDDTNGLVGCGFHRAIVAVISLRAHTAY